MLKRPVGLTPMNQLTSPMAPNMGGMAGGMAGNMALGQIQPQMAAAPMPARPPIRPQRHQWPPIIFFKLWSFVYIYKKETLLLHLFYAFYEELPTNALVSDSDCRDPGDQTGTRAPSPPHRGIQVPGLCVYGPPRRERHHFLHGAEPEGGEVVQPSGHPGSPLLPSSNKGKKKHWFQMYFFFVEFQFQG
jgi:hypothetical protein